MNVSCGICLSHKDSLYCRSCINYKLFELRLLFINSQYAHELSQKKISEILRECFDKDNNNLLEFFIRNCAHEPEKDDSGDSTWANDYESIINSDNFMDPNSIPSPDPAAKSLLASQLLKFHILAKKHTIANIQKSKTDITSSIDELKSKIEALKELKKDKEELLSSLTGMMLKSKQETIKEIKQDISLYKSEKLPNSIKLINSLKFNLYQELLNLSIQKFKHKHQKQIMIQYVSIIEVHQFSNVSLNTINTFLEHLITLQIFFSDYLIIDLPFKDLVKLLPTSSFYNTLILPEEKSTSNPPQDQEKHDPIADISNLDKKLTIYNLPLSSKTINSKLRRVSLNTAYSNTSIETIDKKTIRESRETSPNSANSKIIPHKIIVKPIKSLNQQELFRFVLILSKIMINFKFIINSVSGSSNFSFADDDNFSFNKVINKVIKLDDFFFKKLEDKSIVLDASYIQRPTSVDTKDISNDKKWGFGSLYQSIIHNNIFKKKNPAQPSVLSETSETSDTGKMIIDEDSLLVPEQNNDVDVDMIMKRIYGLINPKKEKKKVDNDEWDIIPKSKGGA